MRRREFIGLLLGGVAAPWPLAAQPQQASKVYRVGLILATIPVSKMVGSDPIHPSTKAFLHGLRALGYIEGQNLVLERRSAEGRFERFGEIVAELVRLKVDVIVTASGNVVVQEAKRVTRVVPIVMTGSYDPVEAGLVASLARPGGNVTGFTAHAGPEIEAKRLQMLKEAFPEATRVAYLGTKSDWEGPEGEHVRAAAHMLDVTMVHAEHTPTHYTDAFALIARDRPRALFVARRPGPSLNHSSSPRLRSSNDCPACIPTVHSSRPAG